MLAYHMACVSSATSKARISVIEYRFAEGKYERFDDFANELVRLKVDVIVLATPAAVPAMQKATDAIPIVMGYSTDPVGRPRCLEIDDHFVLGRRLHRQVARLRALEDAIDVACSLPVLVG